MPPLRDLAALTSIALAPISIAACGGDDDGEEAGPGEVNEIEVLLSFPRL